MKKFKLEIEETVVFRHTITVEAESLNDINEACDSIEKNEILQSGSDYALCLEEKGFKNIECMWDGSGDSHLKCTDLEEM